MQSNTVGGIYWSPVFLEVPCPAAAAAERYECREIIRITSLIICPLLDGEMRCFQEAAAQWGCDSR